MALNNIDLLFNNIHDIKEQNRKKANYKYKQSVKGKIAAYNFSKTDKARKKQLEEMKDKQEINKMPDSDNSTYLTDSDNSEDEKNDKIEHVESVEHIEPVTHDKDISLSIKELMEELQETREENDNLRSILKNTNYLVEILNDQLISFHKQLNEIEIKNKMNDINNNVDDGDQEENNYMDDGELDQNEENQIEQQIEEEEQPAIKQIKTDISDDKFYIDRNGNKIKFFDPDEHLTLLQPNRTMIKKEKNNSDIPIIYYI